MKRAKLVKEGYIPCAEFLDQTVIPIVTEALNELIKQRYIFRFTTNNKKAKETG